MSFLEQLTKGAAGMVQNAGSGILNFGLGQIGAAIQHKRDMKKMAQQQDYALEQMAQSQEYNLANMEQQNQYQIAAEERANEWNSIGSQVERARAAGVSPLAALGGGGAGGMMSVSSAPTGGAPSGSAPSGGVPSSSSPMFDLAGAARGDAVAQAEIQRMEQETNLIKQQIVEKEIENYIAENTKHYEVLLKQYGSEIAGLNVQITQFENSVKEIKFATDNKSKLTAIQKASTEIASIALHDKIDKSMSDATIKKMANQIMLNNSQIAVNNASVSEIEARTLLAGANYLLSLSQSEYYDVMTVNGWSDNQAKQIRNDLEKNRADFENAHREQIHRQSMRNQRWDNAFKLMKGVSSLAYAGCAVAGTVVTGGYGGSFAAAGGQIPKDSPLRGTSPNPIGFKP